ncbi:MAG: Lar family restriction alleviation protein [Caulobacteraceae bacterium]
MTVEPLDEGALRQLIIDVRAGVEAGVDLTDPNETTDSTFGGDVLQLAESLEAYLQTAPSVGEDELLPCPSCGSEARHLKEHGAQRVYCTKCGLTTPVTMNDYPVRIWNRRTHPPVAPGG